jgi:hypothetical protein
MVRSVQGQCDWTFNSPDFCGSTELMHYNFCRIHQTLRVTPAMEAGIADHVWTMAEIVALIG